jgi:hypothetical protein
MSHFAKAFTKRASNSRNTSAIASRTFFSEPPKVPSRTKKPELKTPLPPRSTASSIYQNPSQKGNVYNHLARAPPPRAPTPAAPRPPRSASNYSSTLFRHSEPAVQTRRPAPPLTGQVNIANAPLPPLPPRRRATAATARAAQSLYENNNEEGTYLEVEPAAPPRPPRSSRGESYV